MVLNIVSGAAVRLTGSGLGCPDWPTCSQHRLTPPLSFHPVVEFGNRMVVVVLCVGVAVTLVAAVAPGAVAPRPGVAVGGPAGRGDRRGGPRRAVVVYTKLNPYAVMTHFMVGIALLTDAVVLALRAGRRARGRAPVSKVRRRRARASAR